MDPIENAFFDDIIIFEDNYDTDNSEEIKNDGNGKENKKKITTKQSEKLVSAMDGWTDHISKGKMKSDDKTVQLLREWDELTQQLNVLGPPHHTSSEWRRIWTKMKSNKKRKISTGILCNRDENKKVKRKSTFCLSKRNMFATHNIL